jgi:hypothetical protein
MGGGDSIKTGFKVINHEHVNCIEMAQDGIRWKNFLNVVMGVSIL